MSLESPRARRDRARCRWPKTALVGYAHRTQCATPAISLSFVSERARPRNAAEQHEGRAASMNTRGQRILLWTAPPAVALFVLAYCAFPVFSVPLSPTMSPDQVAAFFRGNVR